jgi:hypothetical protein
MAYDLSPEGDAAALKARRAELRAFAEEITEIVAKMPMPETYLEAERGARAVWVADRVLVRMRVETLGDEEAPSGAARHLPRFAGEEKESPTTTPSARSPSPTSGEERSEAESEGWTMPYLMTPVRLRLRNYADRLMEATALLDKPTCYLEGERAQRYALAADRMLGQLYEPVKLAKGAGGGRFEADDDDTGLEPERPAYDDLEAWQNLLITKLHKLAEERRSQGRTETAEAELEAAFDEEKAPLRRCAPPPPRVGEYKEEPLLSYTSPACWGGGPHDGAKRLDAVVGAKEGPSIRVVESIFAPSGAFGKRPCGCAISAPKCNGPCPLPP